MTTTEKAIDLSAWNHPEGADIDFGQVYAAGYRLAYIKATEGDSYFSPWFDRDVARARAAGLWVGPYHFFRRQRPVQAQLNWFLGHTPRLELPPALDLEDEEGLPSPSSPADWSGLAQLAHDFIRGLIAERDAAVLYTNRNYASGLAPSGAPWDAKAWLAEGGANVPAPLEQTGEAAVPGIPGLTDVDVLTSPIGPDPLLEATMASGRTPDEDAEFVTAAYLSIFNRLWDNLETLEGWVNFCQEHGRTQTLAALATSEEGQRVLLERREAFTYLRGLSDAQKAALAARAANQPGEAATPAP